MTILDAIILGTIQGLTEFLPISSSGHLVLGQAVLGVDIPGNVFEVVVHMGTLFSILVVFRQDLWEILRTILQPKTLRFIGYLIIGTIPAAIVGSFYKETIESAFDTVWIVGIALIVTGVLLVLTRWIRHRQNTLNLGTGLGIGMAQALAIIPGMSRSGWTIATALLLGIKPAEAARFSFLLAIPAIVGAGLLTMLDWDAAVNHDLNILIVITGFIASFLVGWGSLAWLLRILRSGKFHWFGIYCILVGVLTWIF